MAECGTHALVEAAIGPCSDSEPALAGGVLDTLEPGVLCLADRGLGSFALWQRARATAAQLLWRATNRVLPELERHADGSYRSAIYANQQSQRKRRDPVATILAA